jgi:capsule polysaccharide export protein KpsE/RkpR
MFRRVNVGSAHEEVKYLEKRTGELRGQADELAARMREFQEAHGIVELESQAKALVNSVAALNSQRIAKQMELEYAQKFSSSDEAGRRQLESQLSVVDEKLFDLEGLPDRAPPPSTRTRSGKGSRPGMFPPAMEVPRLRAEFEKLYRDRKVAEATLVFALDRLEGARAAEARDVSTFVVLDPPTLPTRKSRPIATWFFLAGGFLGLAGSFVIEWWRSVRESPGRGAS